MIEYVLGMVFDPSREHLLMIKRHINPYQGKINGIGGKVDKDENPTEAMVRELKEETNYDLDKLSTFEFIMTVNFKEDNSKLHVFYMKTKKKYPIEIRYSHEGTFNWYNIKKHNLFDAQDDNIAGEGSIAFFTKFIIDLMD
ncbi:NUDIX domain-containing protein [Mycoplasmatota bacterium zrk1]